MSISDFASAFLPDKRVLLVKKITEKTRERKIAWQKTPNGAAAYVPGALRMNFVEAPWASLWTTPRWVIFVVRDELGSELLKVENQSITVPGSESPPPLISTVPWILFAGDPLVNAVTELHNLVRSQEGKGGVEQAIDLLDKM